jgi:hypothetical protein
MLVVGAILAIAAERWFRAIHPDETGDEKKQVDDDADVKEREPPEGGEPTPDADAAPLTSAAYRVYQGH